MDSIFEKYRDRADFLTVYIREDKILFAADTVMPVPYIVDGDAAFMPGIDILDTPTGPRWRRRGEYGF